MPILHLFCLPAVTLTPMEIVHKRPPSGLSVRILYSLFTDFLHTIEYHILIFLGSKFFKISRFTTKESRHVVTLCEMIEIYMCELKSEKKIRNWTFTYIYTVRLLAHYFFLAIFGQSESPQSFSKYTLARLMNKQYKN